MWNPGIGINELLLLVLVSVPLFLFGRRWMAGLLPLTAIAVLATPADPVSTLVVGVPLAAAFVCGVYLSTYIRASDGV